MDTQHQEATWKLEHFVVNAQGPQAFMLVAGTLDIFVKGLP